MSQPTAHDIVKIISLITRRPEAEITREASLRGDLGMDSLAALDMLVSIEEQFGIVIPQDQAHEFKSLQDVLNHLKIS